MANVTSEEIWTLAEAVRAEPDMMSIANDEGRSREVFAVFLGEQGKQPDYKTLIEYMFLCGDAGCLLDLVRLALERGHATRLAKTFMVVSPAGGRDEHQFLIDFWNCEEATEAFSRLVYELPPGMIQNWVNLIRDDENHWLLTIKPEVDKDRYWLSRVKYYLKRQSPDLKRAHQTMVESTRGFRISYPGESMEALLLRRLFNMRSNRWLSMEADDQTLCTMVNQVFEAHAVAGLVPNDAADDMGVTENWNRRLMLQYQRNHGKLMSYQAWVYIPNEQLVSRLVKMDPQKTGPVAGMTKESARMRALVCYYQDLKFEQHRRKLVEKYGEPKSS